MNDSDVDRLIDKTHMRTTKRISQHIRHDHPEVTDKQIDKVNKARPKDSYRHQTIIKYHVTTIQYLQIINMLFRWIYLNNLEIADRNFRNIF